MRISAKWAAACLIASLSFGFMACDGEPVVPPLDNGRAEIAENKAEVSIEKFGLMTPDYVNGDKQAMRPMEGQGEVAFVRLKITNPTDKVITYKANHSEKESVQLCTDPDPKTGTRTDYKSIVFDINKGIHTTNQIVGNRDIQPGETIYDDYLFENPNAPGNKLVVLVPGAMLGDTRVNDRNKKPIVYRFYVNNPPQKEAAIQPAALNEPMVIDGLSVKINSIGKDYPKLDQRNASKPLKYPFAYPKDPFLVMNVTIKNDNAAPLSYEPSHTAEAAGIILELPGGNSLKRIRLDSTVIGKDQVIGKKTIKPGETINDVYFFEAPSSSTPLNFNISGHIFGVRGMYRFALDYKDSNPEAPDLAPYKSEAATDAAAEEAGDAEEAEAAEEAAPAAEEAAAE